MDSFSHHSKYKICKMKVVICIIATLAFKPVLPWRWKIWNIETVFYVL